MRLLDVTESYDTSNETEFDGCHTPLMNSVTLWVFYIMTFLFTLFLLAIEIIQIILKKLKWIEVHNVLQMTHILLIFTYQIAMFFDCYDKSV